MASVSAYTRRKEVSKTLSGISKRDLEHEILTPQEVADMRGVSRNTVIRWIRNGQIPYLRKSTSKAAFYFILRSDAEAFVPPPIGSPLLIGRRG